MARGAAPFAIDAQLDRLAELEFAAADLDDMNMKIAELLLGIRHRALRALGGEHRASIAHLAAALAVKRRLIGEDAHRLAGLRALYALAVFEDGEDRAFSTFRVIAKKFGRPQFLAQVEPELIGGGLARSRPCFARFDPLARHGSVEARAVDLHAALAQRILGQIARETKRVVELERDLAG